MHCGSQLAADCHLMNSSGHKNFASRHSLEKLYDEDSLVSVAKAHFSQQDVLVAKICAVSDGLVVRIAKIKRQPCVVIASRLITVLAIPKVVGH